MSEQDEVVRAVALDGTLRVVAARTTEVARALRCAHDPGPLGAVALSRLATATLLLGATAKGRQQVGIQINGDGPIGELYAIADPKGHVRATIGDPRVEGTLESGLEPAIGMGRFTVIKRLDAESDAYRGVIPIVHGEIGRDLAEYLLSSEQIPSVVAVGEQIGPDGFGAAGGFLLQALPDADDASLEAVEAKISTLPPLGEIIAEGPDALLTRLFGDDVEVMVRYPASMRCTCQRERYARVLVSLGVEELEQLIAEQEVTEAACQFCGTVYTFNREEMSALLYGARLRLKQT